MTIINVFFYLLLIKITWFNMHRVCNICKCTFKLMSVFQIILYQLAIYLSRYCLSSWIIYIMLQIILHNFNRYLYILSFCFFAVVNLNQNIITVDQSHLHVEN